MKKGSDPFTKLLDDDDFLALPLQAQALLVRLLGAYLAGQTLMDDPTRAANRIRASVKDMNRYWKEVRSFFQVYGEELGLDEVERDRSKKSLAGSVGAKARWRKETEMRTGCESHANRIKVPFVHDMEQARGVQVGACAESTSTINSKSTSNILTLLAKPSLAQPAAAPEDKKAKGRRAKAEPTPSHEPSLEEQVKHLAEHGFKGQDGTWFFDAWSNYEEFANDPANLRRPKDGLPSKPRIQNRHNVKLAWARILLGDPSLNCRILLNCLNLYLDHLEDNKLKAGAKEIALERAWAKDYLNFWRDHDYEDFLDEARARVKQLEAQEAKDHEDAQIEQLLFGKVEAM